MYKAEKNSLLKLQLKTPALSLTFDQVAQPRKKVCDVDLTDSTKTTKMAS